MDGHIRKTSRVTTLLIVGLVPLSTALAAYSSASGPTALALAAVVAEHSSMLTAQEKTTVARLFNNEVSHGFPPTQKIYVKADAIICRMSNVDIAERSCEVTFGRQRITLQGREANELTSTASAAGVSSQGAAGTIFTALSHLVCTIDPQEIEQKTGEGANCTFETDR